ncbi:hypothetical protein OIU84_023904 [Salix udensis]|uniref:Uncharacterized protein n=1 Tax=Salix udensis TaxID=889485 RepID=A0AAD6KS45_9ROSI|nr:hypothetical protein OIU84_023904 [Salix udensis]
METKHVARRHSIGSLQKRRMCKRKRKNSERKLSRSIEKIRADMVGAANQLRLDLMFQIVKARAEKDSAKDAFLTQKLRDLMATKTQVV